ncbi:XRE family transcriptional regulator [Weissella diestrammenae]|uniref:XRE family transcriptional regulator n=1 Tax=Weissella diestrammenae TaxID=1162633 RepID=A0A7G9T3R9_9LACO|nr:replication initiation factor domain-containing protein [Weissella diestrammenae]MCM0582726.1 XRE family transcriptional regulator [Weissella diestrammenae]QNN74744.1 XRE family transcriptional regulator [Weissella diestrammenae]
MLTVYIDSFLLISFFLIIIAIYNLVFIYISDDYFAFIIMEVVGIIALLVYRWLIGGQKVIDVNGEFKLADAVFLGTVQHSLRFSLQPTIRVGLMQNDEMVETYEIEIDISKIEALPNIGSKIDIVSIKGNELIGYTGEFLDSDAHYPVSDFIAQFEALSKMKDVGLYQIMKRSDDMDDIAYAEFTGDSLKLLREKYKLTQKDVAAAIDMSVGNIRAIEQENKVIKQKNIDKLIAAYPKFKDLITLQFDWVAFNFPDMNGEDVIKNVLNLKRDLFINRATSQNFYTREYAYGGEKSIYVQDFAPDLDNDNFQKPGATLFLTGMGCRLFEKAMIEQGIDWRGFFNRMYAYKGHATRVDLAINDMDELVDAVQEKKFWSKKKVYNIHGSSDGGWTIDFGKSPFVVRIYDKQKEQAAKGNFTNISTRVELELHGDKATQIIEEWLGSDNLVGSAFDILYTYVVFLNENVDESQMKGFRVREEYIDTLKPNASWALFTALGQKMKFITQPRAQSIERIENWLRNYVCPSLKIVQQTGGWNSLLESINEAELSLEQQELVQATNTKQMSESAVDIRTIQIPGMKELLNM